MGTADADHVTGIGPRCHLTPPLEPESGRAELQLVAAQQEIAAPTHRVQPRRLR